MNTDSKISLRDARPHPGPLPRGEGGSFAVATENLRLRLPDARWKNQRARTAVPSPGGEGQGEGGRKTIFFGPTRGGKCLARLRFEQPSNEETKL